MNKNTIFHINPFVNLFFIFCLICTFQNIHHISNIIQNSEYRTTNSIIMQVFFLMHFISKPSYLPIYAIIHIILNHYLLLIIFGGNTKNIHTISYILMETSIYYALEFCVIIQALYNVVNKNTAWITAMYFCVYFYTHLSFFTSLHPQSKMKINPKWSLFYYTYIIGICIVSYFIDMKGNSIDLNYQIMAKYILEAWLICEIFSRIHVNIWHNFYTEDALFASKGSKTCFIE